MNIGFTKMHGLGNDFVVIDNFNGRISLSEGQVRDLCDRHKGIGADGVILVEKKEDADCFMNYYNSDGTVAEMCGNGVRCTAKFLKDYYLKDKETFRIDTRAGMKEIKWEGEDIFSVNMGKPAFESEDFPVQEKNIEGLDFKFVSMGNPHAVAFGDAEISIIGPKVESNGLFPNKINVELVEETGENKYRVKVWERGCGATLACGTGACAVYAVLGKKEEVTLELPGGELFLSQNEKGEIILKGEAKNVFSGVMEAI